MKNRIRNCRCLIIKRLYNDSEPFGVCGDQRGQVCDEGERREVGRVGDLQGLHQRRQAARAEPERLALDTHSCCHIFEETWSFK